MDKSVDTIKPELERWIMRNEELEIKLKDTMDRCAVLIGLNHDLQKYIKICNKQQENLKSTNKALNTELKSLKEHLTDELRIRDDMILNDLIPRSQ